MSNTYKLPLVLTCQVTGKVVKWTNRQIIDKKIAQYGSLEAFQAQFKCKGAGKTSATVAAQMTKAPIIKQVCEDGVALGKMTSGEYAKSQFGQAREVPTGEVRMVTRVFPYSDGTQCTVTSPAQSGKPNAIEATIKAPHIKINTEQ